MADVELKTDILTCPECGGDYLHQLRSTAFWRKDEDSERGIKVTSGGPEHRVSVETSQEGNPSSRRDGIRIQIICENCGEMKPLFLCLIQRKGKTHLYWGD